MRFFRRHFTVMIVAGAQARLRRFQVKGMQILWGTGALILVLMLALVTPFLAWWGRSLSQELAAAREERDQLAQRSAQIESTLSDLRTKLDGFEDRTSKLGEIAGLKIADGQPHAIGASTNLQQLRPIARADVMRGEADELLERSQLLARRLDTVQRAVEAHVERLAQIPSIVPAPGLIGSSFGWRRDPFTGLQQFNRGVDIEAPTGAPVYAPADGIVVKTERHAGYGNVIYLSHGDGLTTRFGHLSAFRAAPGQRVRRGDLIALVGATGRATASHLHYEVLEGGTQVNPMRYMSGDGLFH